MTSRRDFLGRTAAMGLTLPVLPSIAAMAGRRASTFVDIRRVPDTVIVQTDGAETRLRSVNGQFENADVRVETEHLADALRVRLNAPSTAIKRVGLRWRANIDDVRLIVGDAWERGYGDLEWRGFVPDRVMPWYVATFDGTSTHAYGVRTGANAMCFWQVDPEGISLWADVRSGGVALQLGERTLAVCDVMCRAGHAGESSFAAMRAFCKQLCASPRIPRAPIYGSNDWYWAYGKNSRASVLTDVKNVVDLSPAGGNRPFAVIDDGWQPGRGADKVGLGTWDHGNDKFGDMQSLAAGMKSGGARPGIWYRPLQAPAEVPESLRLARDKNVLDPTIPDVVNKISNDISRIRGWGYELIKHDYSTFDIYGRWGFQMGSAMTRDGWAFASGRGRTTAEVVNDLYKTIRTAAGDMMVIGCNTVSHLSAGVFEICRIGDDTSGTEWSRTRKMGVNTLAFRGVQHGAFYVADPDCVGVTTAIPWSLNKQWLELLASSGTMLFVSLDPSALGAEQRKDLKAAFAIAAEAHPVGEPVRWQHTAWPSEWRLGGRDRRFDWMGGEGAGPG
jgi:alpha-galactosidase